MLARQKVQIPLVLLWVGLGAVPAQAEPASAIPEATLQAKATGAPSPGVRRHKPKLGLTWLGESYFAERMPTRGRPQQQFMNLVLEAAGSAQLDWFEAGGAARGYLGFPEPQDFYSFEIIEASVGAAFIREKDAGLSFHIGRRRQDWNLADRNWALGFMEPQFRWDLLRPSRNGLTGAFLEARYKGLSATVFGSGVALPESGPSSSLRNGIFTSAHSQYSPPPDYTPLMGIDTPIRYTIDMPPITDLVFKPSAGGILAFENNGFFATASYQYKPISQPLLAMRHQGILNIAVNELQPFLRPQIIYSHTMGMDIGYRTPWGVTPWVSVMGDIPEEPKLEEGWTTQRFVPGAVLAAGVDSKVWDIGVNVSFLQTLGGVATDVGLLSPGGYGSLFGNRYPFRTAFSLGLSRPFALAPRHVLSIAGRWIQEFSVGGTLLSSDVEYRFFERYAVGVGADLIAADVGSASNGGGGYVPGMSAYDRVRASLSVSL